MIHGEYSGPGVDTLWNKTDDLLDEFTETGPLTAASSNWLTKRFHAIAEQAAPWSARTTAFTWDSSDYTQRDPTTGRTLRRVSYSSFDGSGGLGSDGTIDVNANGDPAPADDTIAQYRVTKRDPAGRRIEVREFGSHDERNGTPGVNPLGPDGQLFTSDDPVTELSVYTYNATGHEVLEVEYDGPGADANWDTTQDNTVKSYEITNYTAAGIRDWTKEYEDGGDSILQSGDEILVEEATFNTTL